MELTVNTKQIEAYIEQCVSSQVAQLKEELLKEAQAKPDIPNDAPKYKPDDYLTTRDIMDYYRISKQTVYRRKKEMQLFPKFSPGIKLDGRRHRFRELDEFMQFSDTPEYKQELKKRQSVIK